MRFSAASISQTPDSRERNLPYITGDIWQDSTAGNFPTTYSIRLGNGNPQLLCSSISQFIILVTTVSAVRPLTAPVARRRSNLSLTLRYYTDAQRNPSTARRTRTQNDKRCHVLFETMNYVIECGISVSWNWVEIPQGDIPQGNGWYMIMMKTKICANIMKSVPTH